MRGSDLPDGLDLSEYFDVEHGECCCVGCLDAYIIWLEEIDETDDEDDESIQSLRR